ncbi:MAG: DUF4159 domain-containing protein [Planctomyces sp.]|nr:DUF4159 domain-containing protein [Planctomyces sp.]
MKDRHNMTLLPAARREVPWFGLWRLQTLVVCVVLIKFCFVNTAAIAQQPEMTDIELRDEVKRAIEDGVQSLQRSQEPNGSWKRTDRVGLDDWTIGLTAFSVMALINCDVDVNSPSVQNGLNYLRNLPPRSPTSVYETSLVIMALAAAEQYDKDLPQLRLLAQRLEETQEVSGYSSGLWGYDIKGLAGRNSPDRSNGQFAALALREAAYAGVEVSQTTWKRTHDHWVQGQNPDGGWGYKPNDDNSSTGSMTSAGLSTIAITRRMLEDDGDVDAQGRPDCCRPPEPDTVMQKGLAWMGREFTVLANPRESTGNWHYYYLYGVERAGRMSNVRFFGQKDWYRQGARFFVSEQEGSGKWLSRNTPERDASLNTAMALMFLSKGLSRVVVNKLDYNSPNGQTNDQGEWNRHPMDVISLVDLIDTLPGWAPRLTSQVVTLSRLRPETAVLDLNQSPVLFLSGRDAPQLTDEHIGWLRDYVDDGGFIFAVANCDGKNFDQGFRAIIRKMFPEGEASLQRLKSDHPVFRSEYLLNADSTEIWGVDFGCRTSIMYCPEDIACLWQKWKRHDPPNRSLDLKQRILRSTQIGINVIAYATNREPPEKLNEAMVARKNNADSIERGLLQIGKLRHNGGWDTAPRALGNLLTALNETVGVAASTRSYAIPVTLDELSRFPIVYMHGRNRFALQKAQVDALRDYLNRGGVLFADACCGSTSFDRDFRVLVKQIYPDQELTEIPAEHEIFSERIGHAIPQATRRRVTTGAQSSSLKVVKETGKPLLEGVEVDGRMAIIYSRFDISCALEHQASLACDGYLEEDAAKIAVNVILYSMLQDIRWRNMITEVPE